MVARQNRTARPAGRDPKHPRKGEAANGVYDQQPHEYYTTQFQETTTLPPFVSNNTHAGPESVIT